jgi:predicted dehydrogenase/threonine dehydrogenase-like Zn-dependent dehydrogenase
MKQVFIKRGQVLVEEVPAPICDDNSLLIEVAYSLISSGTETAGVSQSQQSLVGRALKHPELVEKVVQKIAQEGIIRSWQSIRGQLDSGMPTGYSCSGTVIRVGRSLGGFRPGMLVACAGAGKASHAEIVSVPGNLSVRVPEGCALKDAASVALGSIALQGVRRTNPSLGESIAVIGLGLVGQLTAQLLTLSGGRVIGFDPMSSRVAVAKTAGIYAGFDSVDNPVDQVMQLTEGVGVDATVITAASPDSEIVQQAMQITRKKGRVVVVGDVGLALKRSPLYEKEIDFLISCSYGPGRYDADYEERGSDYPFAYVRWTEARNMQEYLRLLAEKRLDFAKLIDREFPVNEADKAFQSLRKDTPRPLAVILTYPKSDEVTLTKKLQSSVPVMRRETKGGKIKLAVIGAGAFARGTHLPNIRSLSQFFDLETVVCRNGANARNAAQHFGAHSASTDYEKVLQDPAVEAVLICTRHHTHASQTLQALQAGKHVLVEKPLALNRDELEKIELFFASGNEEKKIPVLFTGFNRRFSPFARKIADWVKERRSPMILNYRINAGYLPLNHWVQTEEGGGRNRGEACHIYDLFTFLTGQPVKRVQAQPITPGSSQYGLFDNFVATISFVDGSVATLTYTAMGAKEHPKEILEVYCEGKVIVMEDFKKLFLKGIRSSQEESRIQNKGHREELLAFATAIRRGGEIAAPFWQQVQATQIAIEVEELIAGSI